MIVKLPFKHAYDWSQRCMCDYDDCFVVSESVRTITLSLTDKGMADLISDSQYYAECMFGEFTDGVDYASAARRCLKAIEKAGYSV